MYWIDMPPLGGRGRAFRTRTIVTNFNLTAPSVSIEGMVDLQADGGSVVCSVAVPPIEVRRADARGAGLKP